MVGGVEDVRALIDADALGKKVGVVVQTTQTLALLQAVVAELLACAQEVRVVNTICAATQERQQAAAALAAQADAHGGCRRQELGQHAAPLRDLR